MFGLENIHLDWQELGFARPWALWLLLALPFLVLLMVRAEVLSRRAVKALIAQRLQPLLSTQVNWGARRLIGGLRILGLAALLLALAGPRMGYREVERESRGLDIIFLIDTSRSMLAQDVKPDRLTRTKLAALDLAEALKGDRLALVAFAGGGFLQVPLTVDYVAMRESIQDLDTDVIPTQGTNFGDALRLAIDAFGNSDKHSRAIVIFSDGEEWSGEADDEVKTLANQGVPVFTVGVGTTEGAPIPEHDRYGNTAYHKDSGGQIVQTKLEEAKLEDIAKKTGGEYLRLEETPRLADVLKNSLKRVDSEAASVTSREPLERFQWPLGLGIALLVLAQLLGDRRERQGLLARGGARRNESAAEPPVPLSGVPTPARVVTRGLVIAFALGIVTGRSHQAMAVSLGEQAVELQKSGKDKEALELYRKQLEKSPDSPLAGQLNFNAGVAAFKAGKTDEAIRGFSQSLLSEDHNLQEQSHYNLGKSFFKKGADARQASPEETVKDWEKAVEQYENTLKLNSQNTKAQANLDYAKKQLEELKKQQEQQKPQDQKQKQDQKKDDQKQDKKDQDQKKDQQSGGQQNQDQPQKDQPQKGQGQKDQKDQPGQDQQAKNDSQKDGQQGKQDSQQQKPGSQDGKGQQAQNDKDKGQEGSPSKPEDQKQGQGDKDDQAKPKPDSGQGNVADNKQQPGGQKGEDQKKDQPSVDDSAKQDGQKPGEDSKGQASQDFQASSNKPEGGESKGEEAQALARGPVAMTQKEASSLLDSLEADEAKGTILESRSTRRPPGKDW